MWNHFPKKSAKRSGYAINLTTLSLLFVALSCEARSDPVPPPLASCAANREVVLRVEVREEGAALPRIFRMYRYDGVKDSYTKVYEGDFGEIGAPEELSISKDGSRVAAIYIGHYRGNDVVGVTLFHNGTVTRRIRLDEMLAEDELTKVGKTGATTRWFSQTGWSGSQFWVRGPDLKYRRDQLYYYIEIDADTGEIVRKHTQLK